MNYHQSPRLRAIRDAHVNAHPEQAAEDAARHFERESIAVPPELVSPAGAPTWQARAYRDAAEMYRTLVMSGASGVALRDLHATMGKERRATALKLLRGTGLVTEAREHALTVLRVL